MELSQTSLIDAVNRVLEDTGERRVLNLGSPVARKAVQAFSTSLLDIANIADFEFLKEHISAVSWNLDTADIGNVQRIHGVSVGSLGTGYISIPWVDVQTYDSHAVVPYAAGQTNPRVYTISGYNAVRMNPYPVLTSEQSRVRFYVTRELTPPVLATDKFPIPERVFPMLYFRACHYFCLSHLDDAAGAAQWANQFEAFVDRVRSRERMLPSSGTNLFKLRNTRRY